jgi:hypothetical protein
VQLVSTIIAGCLVADGNIEAAGLKAALALLKHDDSIPDKKAAIERLNKTIPKLLAARKASAAAFRLQVIAPLAELAQVRDTATKDPLLIILDGMMEGMSDNADANAFANRVRAALGGGQPKLSRKEAVEHYILTSGDRQAIATFRQMQANPGRYGEQLRRGAQNNTILRTAAGVFAGFIAADLVTSAVHQYQLQQALESFDSELEKIGGLDGLTFADAGYTLAETHVDAASSGVCESADTTSPGTLCPPR